MADDMLCCDWSSVVFLSFFFFKQKTAYEMRISDWSSDVCSSDLPCGRDPCKVCRRDPRQLCSPHEAACAAARREGGRYAGGPGRCRSPGRKGEPDAPPNSANPASDSPAHREKPPSRARSGSSHESE